MTMQELAHEAVTRWKNGEFWQGTHEEVHDLGFIVDRNETVLVWTDKKVENVAIVVTLEDGLLELTIGLVDGCGAVVDIETAKIISEF